MRLRDVQMLMASAGFYSGGIDGIDGPKTQAGVSRALAGVGTRWSKKRRLIGAAQSILNAAGFEAGTVDGYAGQNTREALAGWHYERLNGKREDIDRTPANYYQRPSHRSLPSQAEVSSFYGRPGDQIKDRLETVSLPFKLRIDYNLRQRVSRVTLHQKCAPSFVAAITEVRERYGADRMSELGIDRYAGGYSHRKMRGGSKWSMHAYGCAVDFYAAPNGLRMSCPQALFCGSEYRDFLDIMESHGWLPAIRLWGKDAMHFQQARL